MMAKVQKKHLQIIVHHLQKLSDFDYEIKNKSDLWRYVRDIF
jgi:phosphopantetheine adenylyltransferase